MTEPLPVNVRDLQPADREQWERLWAMYLEFYEQDLAPGVTDALWQRLTGPERHPQMFGLTAESADGTLLGFAHCVVGPSTWDVADDVYLEDLAVAPGSRGRGVGRALIEEITSRGRVRNWRRVFWITNEDNAPARRLYDSLAELTPYVQYQRSLR